MLRNAAMPSSALRRLIASTSRNTLLRPAMSTVSRRTDLLTSNSSTYQLFFLAILGQARGFARSSRQLAPSKDDDADFSEGEPEFSATDFDDKDLSEDEEVFDYEDEDEDEDQLQ